MNSYISDTHFGHKNCISFDNRPFSDVDEMDSELITRWNNKVTNDDEVYILGDFAVNNKRDEVWYLEQLNGHKHLVIGNHDDRLLKNADAMKYFESVDKIMGIRDYVNGKKMVVVLCHFPMVEWYRSRHGAWHVFEHIHGDVSTSAKCMSGLEHTLNAGAVVNNYEPSTMDELIRNNALFREKYLQ